VSVAKASWSDWVLAGLLVLLLLLACGCSSTGKIAKAAVNVNDLAVGISEDAAEATIEYEEGRDPRPFHQSIDEKAESIRREAKMIQRQIPDVEDREGLLEKAMKAAMWIGIAVAIGALVYLCGGFLRPLANRLGLLIGPKAKAEAKLDQEVLAGKTDPKEAIAAKRGMDPEYDAAWKKQGAAS